MERAKIVRENRKQARKTKVFTRKQVAAMLGKYQPDYSEYETGKIELDYAKIVFLCEKLNVTPNDLFGWK